PRTIMGASAIRLAPRRPCRHPSRLRRKTADLTPSVRPETIIPRLGQRRLMITFRRRTSSTTRTTPRRGVLIPPRAKTLRLLGGMPSIRNPRILNLPADRVPTAIQVQVHGTIPVHTRAENNAAAAQDLSSGARQSAAFFGAECLRPRGHSALLASEC